MKKIIKRAYSIFQISICGILFSMLANAAEETHVVTDYAGSVVEIPVQPERIVVISEVDLDALLALGIKPHGTLNGRGQNTPSRYLGSAMEGILVVGEFFRPNLELLLAAEPDLILAGGTPVPQIMEVLPEVAPTLVTYNLGDNWKKSFSQIAELLDQEEAFNDFMDGYNRRVAEVKAALTERDIGTVSLVRWNPNGPGYMLDQSFSTLVMNDLGLQRPAAQVGSGIAHSEVLSLEALHLIDADYIFIGTMATTGEAVDALMKAIDSPAYQQLEAVKNDHVIAVDGSLFTSMGGPLAALKVIDVVEASLLK